MNAWLNHQWPALVIVGAILTSWTILSIPTAVVLGKVLRGWDRANARRDAAHAAELAAAHTSLGTLLPGPSETPVHDRCVAIYGVVPEVRS